MGSEQAEGPLVFAGSASPRLTTEICGHLGITAGQGEVLRFSEGTLFPRVLENVRGRRVYLVQSTVYPANDHFMELLFWIDALKRASAASVTAVTALALARLQASIQNSSSMKWSLAGKTVDWTT